ncbi:beta-lactamase family protein [Spirosoma sp. BT702]|uniref:Beta-lactamase family protein n=1 Tax=Spirosoma profusum TaxID=2771354 RepID=A0A926XY41_9BACT|nr:serine hydrolase domain-containing protein [Spirosoma profusum]MBD2699948.1 beta-lactamase family protein [Spirosoma profusum]
MPNVVIAGLLLLATPLFAQLPARLDSLMQATTKPNLPGAALLVEIDGKVIYQHGSGLSNVAQKKGISPTTNFRMASVTKQFTAMSILLLEKEGKLSLDDPLIRFFPELNVQVARKVQIQNLLTHSSGILDYESLMSPKQTKQLLDEDVLNLLKDRDSLYFEPGSQFRYSNSGYCLLALLIERVSGDTYATFLRERIFKPLQMNQSVIYEAGKPIANRAMGYRKKGKIFAFSDQSLTSATKGDGGVYTSLTDYQKWINALRNNTLLELKAILNRTKQTISTNPGSYYAAGWFFRQPNNPVLFHSGSTSGFNNFVVSIPDKKFLMAYFSNKADNKANAAAVLKLLASANPTELADILTLDELTQ